MHSDANPTRIMLNPSSSFSSRLGWAGLRCLRFSSAFFIVPTVFGAMRATEATTQSVSQREGEETENEREEEVASVIQGGHRVLDITLRCER